MHGQDLADVSTSFYRPSSVVVGIGTAIKNVFLMSGVCSIKLACRLIVCRLDAIANRESRKM